MRVIPVMDLLGGQVVRGVGGNRANYRPIVSKIVGSAFPQQVGQALRDVFTLEEFYVADLDAIAGRETAWPVLRDLAELDVRILIDAGVGDGPTAHRLSQFARQSGHVSGVVVGLESLSTPRMLTEVSQAIDPELRVFSLDLRAGVPIAGAAWQEYSPLDLAKFAVDANFSRLIILDLADVGRQGGTTTLSLVEQVREAHPTVEIIAGGGVRSVDDLRRLATAGCDAALVASALHDGNLDAAQLPGLAALD